MPRQLYETCFYTFYYTASATICSQLQLVWAAYFLCAQRMKTKCVLNLCFIKQPTDVLYKNTVDNILN